MKNSTDSELTGGNVETRESSSMGSVELNQKTKRTFVRPKFSVKMPVFDIRVKITA